ncbi:MAG TPA: hypothetical protein VD931_01015, partial [Baekduia sp.]|nr:hypothetical protein [Baekduia sp.]
AERLAAGRAIFHPGDLRYDEEHPMPRDLAERMRAREAKEQQELKRRRARLKAAKRSKEEQARREAEADAAVPWRAYRCCLFGAVLRGQCPCSSPRLKLPRGRRPRRPARRAVPGPVLYDPADGSPALAGAG